MSLALDTVRMLIDSVASLWQRLERYAVLDARPQQSAYTLWLAGVASEQYLDAAEEQQLQRDYRRLCSLLDQLETLLHDSPSALAAVRSRLSEQQANP